jgi:hypothetical protein
MESHLPGPGVAAAQQARTNDFDVLSHNDPGSLCAAFQPKTAGSA